MAMAARPQTPVQDAYSIPQPSEPGILSRGYGTLRSSSRPSSYAGTGSAFHYGPLDQTIPHNPRFREEFDTASHRSSVVLDRPEYNQLDLRPGLLREEALLELLHVLAGGRA